MDTIQPRLHFKAFAIQTGPAIPLDTVGAWLAIRA